MATWIGAPPKVVPGARVPSANTLDMPLAVSVEGAPNTFQKILGNTFSGVLESAFKSQPTYGGPVEFPRQEMFRAGLLLPASA